MVSLFLVLLIIIGYAVIGFALRKYPGAEKTKKVTKPLSWVIDLSPLIGLVIFSILFTCVLETQIMARVTHAIIVFDLWLLATQFYCFILTYYKQKWSLICCSVGMIYAIGLAIYLTPLDRYIASLYIFMDWPSLFLGCGILIIFYAIKFITIKSKKVENR